MTKLELQKWNAKYPEGSLGFMVSDDGKRTKTWITSSAWLLWGCDPVVRVKNCSVPYPISRLRMADRKKMPHAKCLSLAPLLHRPDDNIGNFEEYANPLERIRTLSDLVYAVACRKSVIHAMWNKPRPAAVVINLNGATLYRLLNEGIYAYRKPKP